MRTLPPVEVFGLEYSFSPRVGVILVVPASSPTMLGIYLVLFFKSFHLGVHGMSGGLHFSLLLDENRFRLDGLGCSCLELFYEIFELGKPVWVALQDSMGLRMA
jgi:hypothetical protein